jgi:ubiquinone/menaquinone biosynthesis C-methylase UbiE
MPAAATLSERLFAAYYPLLLERAERAGQRETRRRLVGQAVGRTLELGAGTGVNAPHYTSQVTRLVITDRSEPMLGKLRSHLAREPPAALDWSLERVDAEALPFGDASFETVVATYLLCSVPEPLSALSEVARVLVPGGRYLFLEHVRARAGSLLGAFQDLVESPHRWAAAGCRPNRHTAELISASPLQLERLERGRQPSALPTVRPTILGSAVRG